MAAIWLGIGAAAAIAAVAATAVQSSVAQAADGNRSSYGVTPPTEAAPTATAPRVTEAGDGRQTTGQTTDQRTGQTTGQNARQNGSETAGARRAAAGNLVGHGGPIKALAVDAERGRVLSGSFDYAMTAWDVTGEAPRELHRFAEHDGAVNAVAFLPDGRRAIAAGDDGSVTLWALDTGKRLHRFTGHTAKINHVSVSDDGRWAVTSSWDRTARVWDLEKLAAGPVLEGHKGPVNAAVFSADATGVYTASYDGTIGYFQREDGDFVRPVAQHGWGINVLARLPGGEHLVFGALNGAIKVVDGATGKDIRELEAFERPVLSVAVVAKPGLVALGGADGTIRVLRLADWSVIETYQNPYGPVWALAFAPGGTALYFGGLDDFVTLWQITPRAPFEHVENAFPRRFQLTGATDDPIAKGEIQFARKCSVCHTLKPDGRNRAGPTLHNIFGRRIATVDGYPYSKGLRELDIVWTEETVAKLFELGPDKFTPGSKMPLQKMTNPEQRAALIAFLKVATTGDGAALPDEKADRNEKAERGSP
ncbi:MAG: c-type cytochrome [Hyphomicrobiaceae bacterium]|nr:c-type cytochrome [Hyphomicrobiaceae bacterium]